MKLFGDRILSAILSFKRHLSLLTKGKLKSLTGLARISETVFLAFLLPA